MDGAGEEFLAGAAFAQQEDGRIRRRNALDLLAGFLHRWVLAHDAREAVARRVLLAQEQVFPEQFVLPRRALDEQLQMVQVHRLLDEVECAFLHRRHGFFHRAVGGDQEHGDGRVGLLSGAEDFDSGAAGQLQVGEDEHITPVTDFLDRSGAVRGLVHSVAGALERLAQHRAQLGFVFHQ